MNNTTKVIIGVGAAAIIGYLFWYKPKHITKSFAGFTRRNLTGLKMNKPAGDGFASSSARAQTKCAGAEANGNYYVAGSDGNCYKYHRNGNPCTSSSPCAD